MKYIPCPFCQRMFTSAESLNRHIRRKVGRQGHGNKICPNCQKPLSECKDIDGVGQSFMCEKRVEQP